MSDIPPEVLAAIKSMAESEWPGDPEMQEEEINADVHAYHALQIVPDDISPEHFEQLKRDARVENETYSGQWYEVEQRIVEYRYAQDARARIEPIRDLLMQMERIIGSECYNGHIQNYGPGGVWQGEGRGFRYPVTFIKDGDVLRGGIRSKDMPAEALITGHYRFGANRLGIYRALLKIIDMLEADYGLKIPRA